MANSRDFTGKNRKFTGVKGVVTPKGTTGERDTSFGQGTLRFNTTNQLMEYYDGTIWKSIDAPPSISSITPNSFKSDGSTLFNIAVSGENFGIGCTAKWIGNDGTEYNSAVVTRNTVSSITVQTVASMNVANEPYDLQVTNVSSLSAIAEDVLDAGSTPAFTATAGTLGTLYNFALGASNLATQTFGPSADADSTVIQYSIISGSLTPGLSLGTGANNGKIVGTATSSNTSSTSTFTIQASDGINTNSRQYSITRNGPVRESFTAAGSFTFTVPTGMTSVNVLVVAGGGGGGAANSSNGSDGGGGGGAGGLIYVPAFPVTPGGTVSGNVGSGGAGSPDFGSGANGSGAAGQDSTFGTLTAKGGGFGCALNTTAGQGGSGGSGGYGSTAGSGTQPSQPGQSGSFGFGNNGGGPNPSASPYAGAGGGGAGGAGVARTGGAAGAGGIGRTYTIADGSNPVYYAGGGAGGPGGPGTYSSTSGGQGGGGPSPGTTGSPRNGTPGTVNTGGGAGGGAGNNDGSSPGAGQGGVGGRGIVIVEEA